MPRTLFLLAIGASLTWPLLLQRQSAAGQLLSIKPGVDAVFESSNRGLDENFAFELLNVTGGQLEVTISATSCDCLAAQLDRTHLGAGESANLLVRTRVPLAGFANGALVIDATPLDDIHPSKTNRTTIRFSIHAGQAERLRVTPENVIYGPRHRSRERRVLASLRVLSSEAPLDAEAISSSMEGLAMNLVGAWERLDRGAFTAIAELFIPPLDLDFAAGDISIQVTLADGSLATASISLHIL